MYITARTNVRALKFRTCTQNIGLEPAILRAVICILLLLNSDGAGHSEHFGALCNTALWSSLEKSTLKYSTRSLEQSGAL